MARVERRAFGGNKGKCKVLDWCQQGKKDLHEGSGKVLSKLKVSFWYQTSDLSTVACGAPVDVLDCAVDVAVFVVTVSCLEFGVCSCFLLLSLFGVCSSCFLADIPYTVQIVSASTAYLPPLQHDANKPE